MLKKLKNYFRAASSAEAVCILKQCEGTAKILAGGTTVGIMKSDSVETLVDIKYSGLNYIEENETDILIGAATSINDILQSMAVKKYCGSIIHQAAYSIASTPLRNMITAGGNITQVYHWSDLPVVFLCAGAKIKIEGPENKVRIASAADFFRAHPLTFLGKTELVTQIILPKTNSSRGIFTKFAKTAFDYTLLNVAAIYDRDAQENKRIKICVSGAGSLPQELKKTSEKISQNINNSGAIFNDILELAVQETSFITEMRVTTDYKKSILPALIKRTTEQALG